MEKRTNFYDILIDLSKYTVRASDMLRRTLSEFEYEDMKYLVVEIHEIENDADQVYHKIQRSLERQYILPLKREDIMELGHAIDQVVDCVEDIMMAFYMYDIKSIRPTTPTFIDIIVDSCNSIVLLMKNFKTAKKYEELEDLVKHIRGLEDRADKIYIESNKEIFTNLDPKEMLKHEEITLRLESCVDACKKVADTVSNVFLKNT